ncbi:molybdopterin-dependent oxidoreductase [Arsenicicoccus piscis]|uniref:Oxidoreductase n=1 Tax=Arsenicicoccus piscis TaxID=673954 RepID=A0ABQ6HV05_9MICO|nr:molybdopterin-dependent oxidoreductase [Arsenicicoccus piscis]MCH8627516.1 molybdopterin-dependent oxidoreductase [Arsenicicoccus piscis]GMA21693.1 putative oxidoreductase [Arsenicicoccus piscis]
METTQVRAQGTPSGRLEPAGLGAVVGLATGAVTVGAAELLAGLGQRAGWASGTPSPIDAVGAAFIDRAPPWLKDFAVSTFGTNDKMALYVGITLVLVLLSCAMGVTAVRSRRAGVAVLLLLGTVAAAAVLSRPHASSTDLVPLLIGVVAGWWLLTRWTGRFVQRPARTGSSGSTVASREVAAQGRSPREARSVSSVSSVSRRVVLGSGLAAVAAGAVGVLVGRVVAGSVRAASVARDAFRVPPVARRVTVPAGADLGIRGVTPFIVPNAEFYRIDTALVVPQVDPATWSLRVTGMVEREITLDWATLLSKPMQEAMVTLMCVSNEVGGTLNGNAVWTGWPVRELLKEAGVRPGADMVLSTSVDGFTAGTPLEAMTDDRSTLLVVAQNGEALLPEHGFPVRLVVPGLYGYVSATKWVSELKVTTFADDMGYWTPRGWSALGPVKTQSRIDVPRDGDTVAAGTVAVAGVAWAQHRGISGVQVRVDSGPWEQARLGTDATIDAWRQWVYEWPATSGRHTLTIRAIDADGRPETDKVAPPAPDGASGYHSIQVTVS